MRQLNVFFDYACPYCYRAHEHLAELAPQYYDIEILWRPCEAHPRPDRYGPHSDMCIRGMFYARDKGADLWEYHRRIYAAAHEARVNIEDVEVVAGIVHGLLDMNDFYQALQDGQYEQELQDANDYAYGQSGVWVVPAYRLNGRKLDAVENVGVSKTEIVQFLNQK